MDEAAETAGHGLDSGESSPETPVADARATIEATAAAGLANAAVADQPPGPGLLAAGGWMLVFLAGQMVFAAFSGFALAIVLFAIGKQSQSIDLIKQWAPAIGTLGTLLMAWLMVWTKFGSQAPRILGLRRPDLAQLAVVVLLVGPLYVVAVGVKSVVDAWIPLTHDIQAEALLSIVWAGWLSILIAGGLLPAVGEEVFFRGFVGRGLVARYGVVPGVLLTSLAFGLFHLMPAQIAATFVIGLGFHGVYLASKSLPAAMLLHFLINCLGLSIARVWNLPGGHPRPDGKSFEQFPPLTVLSAALALGLLILVAYRLRTRWVFPGHAAWEVPYVTAEAPPIAARATRDSVAKHRWLAVLTLVVWACFARAFVQSGVFGP